jgi:outer membrane protein OmpA-like peptidoglycan-associated protein
MTDSRSSVNVWLSFSDLFAGLMLFFVSAVIVDGARIRRQQDDIRRQQDEIKFSAELVRAMNLATHTTEAFRNSLRGRLTKNIGIGYSETEVSIPSAALFRPCGFEDFTTDAEKRELLASIGTGLLAALNSAGEDSRFLRVILEGHTDSDPIGRSLACRETPTNWELSSRRATGVLRFFEGLGLDPQRYNVVATGLADTQPTAPNTDDAGKAKNRRIVIRLEPDLPAILQSIKSKDTK